MAPVNPPYCLQANADKHPAQLFRQAISTLINAAGGLVATGGLQVSQKTTPNMSVEVLGGTPAEGGIWIPGTVTTGTQGLYYCWNSATYNVTIATAGTTNPRIDTIIARVKDEQYEGAANEWVIEALKGGESESGVTLANKKSSPATVPANSYVLAYVLVPAKATTIVTADIENVATTVHLSGGPQNTVIRTTSGTMGTWETTFAEGNGINLTLPANPPAGCIQTICPLTYACSVFPNTGQSIDWFQVNAPSSIPLQARSPALVLQYAGSGTWVALAGPIPFVLHSSNFTLEPGEVAETTATCTGALPKVVAGARLAAYVAAGELTLKCEHGENIFGDFVAAASTIKLTQYQHVELVSDGGSWLIVAGEPKNETGYSRFTPANNTAYEPSSSRKALVVLTIKVAGSTGDYGAWVVEVGGVQISAGIIPSLTGQASSAICTFEVPAGQKWLCNVTRNYYQLELAQLIK